MKKYDHTAVCKCGWTYGAHSWMDDACPKEKPNGKIKQAKFYKNKFFELAPKKKKAKKV